MEKLQIKTARCHIVIEQYDKKNKKELKKDYLEEQLKKMGVSYWCILHDKDLLDDGTLKHPHYHLVLSSHSPRMLQTWLNDLTNLLVIDTRCITIARVNDLLQNIRYLMHLDDTAKYQYDLMDVISNDISLLNESLFYITSLTTSELINIVNNSRDLTHLVSTIGIYHYKKYAIVIHDLWKEKYQDTQKTLNAVKNARDYIINKVSYKLNELGLKHEVECFTDEIIRELHNMRFDEVDL